VRLPFSRGGVAGLESGHESVGPVPLKRAPGAVAEDEPWQRRDVIVRATLADPHLLSRSQLSVERGAKPQAGRLKRLTGMRRRRGP
jgi:hypothetical protein